jgi:hypothetical protein
MSLDDAFAHGRLGWDADGRMALVVYAIAPLVCFF